MSCILFQQNTFSVHFVELERRNYKCSACRFTIFGIHNCINAAVYVTFLCEFLKSYAIQRTNTEKVNLGHLL